MNDIGRKKSARRARPDGEATVWSDRLDVAVGGAGTVARAGVCLPRLLADRVGLTEGLAVAVARAGFVPVRHRGRWSTRRARWPPGRRAFRTWRR